MREHITPRHSVMDMLVVYSIVQYRVQLFRVRVEYESGGVEYGPSTSLRVSQDSLTIN